MTTARTSNSASLLAFVVVSMAIVGYFTGLQAPMKDRAVKSDARNILSPESVGQAIEAGVIPSTHYLNMPAVTEARRQRSVLSNLKLQAATTEEIRITAEDKLAALQLRSQSRAFNGAPPVIPHPIDQQSDTSCLACHQNGGTTATLRIPRMSHHLLSNCTQCHVEERPKHMPATVFRESTFMGLAAPQSGPKAFPGAPPQIPHTTWMRSDCLSCHGASTQHGIRTTHPWRTSCQQCHAPSAVSEQAYFSSDSRFLPGPKVNGEYKR